MVIIVRLNIWIKVLTILVLSSLAATSASCQNKDLADTLLEYHEKNNPDLLFVHTDKHIYTNNEFLWFSAYLLNWGKETLTAHQFLSLALVQAGTHESIVQQKFVMVNGRSAGSLKLPDSIPPGEYKLLATTNLITRDSVPIASFTQALSVRSTHKPDFSAYLNILEDNGGKKTIEIVVQEKASGLPIREAEILLWIGAGKAIQGSPDKKGTFRQVLPVSSITDTSTLTINAKIKYHGDLVYLQKPLQPIKKDRQLHIKFYPEGGKILAEAVCQVGWESLTNKGEPVALRAVLFRNDIAIDTLLTDSHGLGSFKLKADQASAYKLVPLNLPAGVVSGEVAFTLPTATATGISLHLQKAIASDSLRFRISTNGYRTVKLLVHDFKNIFAVQDIVINGAYRDVLILLDQIPKGLVSITLLDSLGRPQAERIFFSHYTRTSLLQTSLDKKVYGKREKITLKLDYKIDSLFTNGFVSVSCAQANRFAGDKQQDLESFSLLYSRLQEINNYPQGRILDDSVFLEKLILVKGWRNYSWNDMVSNRPGMPDLFSPRVAGRVTGFYRKIKKPLALSLIGGNNTFDMVTTDSTGNFYLDYENLLVDQDKRIWIAPNQKNLAENFVEVFDPFRAITDRVAAKLNFEVIDANRFTQNSEELVLNDLPMAKTLQVFTVVARKDNFIYGSANKCGDYVCPYNILNCPNHPGNPSNHLPVKGRTYNSPGGGSTVYWGCALEDETKKGMILLDGIKIGKSFYGEDFSTKSSGEQEYISTLFWSPALEFDKDGHAACSFYSGDITGRFRIVINGMSNKELLYASDAFEVK